MFPESKWVINDLLNKYVPDEGSQRLLKEYLDEILLEDSLGDIYGALGRLERATESSNQEPDSQEPLIEESSNQESVVEEPVEQEPLIEEPVEQETVVEEPEQKKVDTSESKLQKLLANVLKK